MSNHVISLVSSRNLGVGFPAKSILLYMADKASDDGSGVWVSKSRIARELETTDRTVQRKIDDLTKMGFLKMAGRRAHKNGFTFDYTIDVSLVASMPSSKDTPPTVCQGSAQVVDGATQDVAPVTPSPLSHRHPTPDSLSPEPPTGCHPNPNTTINEPCEADAPHTDLFNEFWEAYPKPNNEAASKQLFDDAVKAGADPSHIVAAAVAYEAENKGNSPRYLKFSDNWLREEKWKNHKASEAKKVFTNDERLNFYAKIINSAKPVSPSAINVGLANELLAAGLVTPEKLKERGIAA